MLNCFSGGLLKSVSHVVLEKTGAIPHHTSAIPHHSSAIPHHSEGRSLQWNKTWRQSPSLQGHVVVCLAVVCLRMVFTEQFLLYFPGDKYGLLKSSHGRVLYGTIENYQQAFALANVMLPEEWCSLRVSGHLNKQEEAGYEQRVAASGFSALLWDRQPPFSRSSLGIWLIHGQNAAFPFPDSGCQTNTTLCCAMCPYW
ncbi:hypothetical protein Q9233_009274 [Columba guinea]|nr:hypothetical protein Q9233_009274 [Columba guinea]